MAQPARSRTRLDPAGRRRQLLDVGARLFAERPYDLVSIEEIAVRAGVSRGLMYRYFATKRDLFRAVVQATADHMIDLTDPDPALPLEQQILAGLDRYLDHFEANATLIRAAYTGAASADEHVRAIIADKARRHEDRLLDRLRQAGVPETPRLRVALRGWILMCRMLILDWLDTREISRTELRDVCAQSLLDLAAHAGRQSTAAAP
ncbi:helix-turn-helix domain-containing protein [Nonomuraea sp. NPDC049158]|uniref:TetR/AcrR family transcriptional regulator n=1 Tax=Nonomuraea sp. NPDC049158 TaxID=3155649 RepID=UPI0033DC48C9